MSVRPALSGDAARLRVALKKGLTKTQVRRLVDDTEEELEADADDLLATFAPAQADTDVPLRPRVMPDKTDPAKLVEAVPRSALAPSRREDRVGRSLSNGAPAQ